MQLLYFLWKPVRKFICNGLIPFCPFNTLRIWGYRLCGFKIGKGVFIGMHCYLDDTYPNRLVIDDKVVVSYRVTFACHGPRTSDYKLILRKGSYVGCSSTLLGGSMSGDITIGPYATIGACSLVNRNIPPLATVAGIPVRLMRTTRQPWVSDSPKATKWQEKFLHPSIQSPVIHESMPDDSGSFLVKILPDQHWDTLIRFTLDGSDPDEESKKYLAPLYLQKGQILKVRLYQAGHHPSEIITKTIDFQPS